MILTLVGIGLLAGVVAGLSPCVLPVLPAILASSVSTGGVRRRPALVVAGLVLSFSVTLLLGSALISSLGLPADTLTDIGVAFLALVGLSLLWPALAHVLERPFQRFSRVRTRGRSGSGLVLGLSLGLVFVPCAGPVLAAVTTLAAAGHLGAGTIALTLGYGLGVALPLWLLATAGQRLSLRTTSLRTGSATVRRVAGAVLVVSAVAIASGALAPLQRSLPGYTSDLQASLEDTSSVRGQLGDLRTQQQGTSNAAPVQADGEPLADCLARVEKAGGLVDKGCTAPDFTGISSWLNTPGDQPLTLAGLRGKVVLVDFWTYSCINCQRTLPALVRDDRQFAAAGLTVVGVHTPEFAFEHDRGNIASAAGDLGVTWPIAVDNDYGTWNAYSNAYWPAEYLIDQTGHVRHVHYGEGGYDETAQLIGELLHEPVAAAPSAPALRTIAHQTPETYVGYEKARRTANDGYVKDQEAPYTLADPQPGDSISLGGRWVVGAEQARAAEGATLALRFAASQAYLVLAGEGTIGRTLDGKDLGPLTVSGTPRLYTVYDGALVAEGRLVLTLSPGLQAYSFTFG